ncbi:putative nepenthesin [Helianthus annuus]|nr:putative nepenthesin [Helianthus annuus]KAJ0706854.1 putative nepenthesin [Helianthus annuus]
MASSYSLILLLSCCSLFFVFITATQEFAFNTSEGEEAHHYHTLQLTSLLPSSVCNPSALGNKRSRGSLEVVHKHGPCSTLNEDTVKSLTVEEILTNDQSRVDSIRARLATKTGKKDIFAPSKSTTYSNISCTATQCSELTSATGNDPGCSASTCVYGIQYGDQSFSVGFFGKEKLTLTSKDVVNGFFFGCGQNNQGLFGGAAGLLGLGRDRLSIVSQTANKYRKVFSYCLPSRSSSTGYLTFGSSGVGRKVKYTRLSGSSRSFYGLTLTAITVGGTKLPISPTVFQTSGIIIDSGTVITRLPPTAYSALSKAFKAQMKKYPLTRSLSILDTCYDLTNYQTVEIPKISVLWGGNTLVEIAPQGILYANGVSQVCLAFAPNGDDSDIGIFGNVQQKSLAVVYDVAGGRVGFAQGGCA